MNKAQISANYTAQEKDLHHWKRDLVFKSILITGDERKGSIGEAIRDLMIERSHAVDSFGGDIRNLLSIKAQTFSYHDTLILCHGVTHLDWIEDCPEEKIREIIDVNVTGTINIIQQFVKQTINNPHKKNIIVIGSMASKAVLNGSAVYCASKAALNHFVKCIAWELAPKAYSAFIINPSNTEGAPMSEDTIQGLMRYRNLSREEAEAYWGASLPKDRWLQTHDIANLCDFLLSRKGEYLSGSCLDLAGGQR